MNYCKNFDRPNEKSDANAPPRLPHEQPTMYDHLPVSQKFKEGKEKQEYIKARHEELLMFDDAFTNLHLDPSGDVFEEFSTQDIANFRQELRGAQQQTGTNPGFCEPADVEEDAIQLKKPPSLLIISRAPVQCPVSKCQQTFGVTSMLSHYLRDHNKELYIQYKEIFSGERLLLVFDPNNFNFRENICLGVLAYGGIDKESHSRPVAQGICMPNAFIPKPYDHLEAHLPVLIMTCKTSMTAFLSNKRLEAEITDPLDKKQHLLVIWLVSVQTTKPVYCTITAFDKEMTSTRSTTTRVRHLNEPQNPSDFIASDINYLRLSYGEIDVLSKQGTENIHLEIIVNDFN